MVWSIRPVSANDCLMDFLLKFGRQGFVCVEQQNPIEGERQILHGPLPFLRPTTLIVELNHLCAEGTSDFSSGIGALGIDDIDLANIAQRLQTTRQIFLFIARGDDHADRQFAGRRNRVRLGDFFDFLHL